MLLPKISPIQTALAKAYKNEVSALGQPAPETAAPLAGETVVPPQTPLSEPPPLEPPEKLRVLSLDEGGLTAGNIFASPAAARELERLSGWLLKTVEGSGHLGLTVAGIRPGAGCSSLAWSLALAWAQSRPGRRVLLIETNWRAPGLEKIAGLAQGPGLSDYLSGRIDLPDLLGEIGPGRLILAGAGQPWNPGPSLLSSPRIRNLIYGLRRLYPGQLTIFDAPALVSPEALALSRPGDNMLLVADQATVIKDDFRFAAGLLKRRRLPVLGVIMNRGRGFH